MRLLLIGPPGSGKGTQAGIISKKLHVPHISSGDMLRETISKGNSLGKEAEHYMSQGALVPDKLVIKIIMERLAEPDAKAGFLLDGFPRTVPQAEALDNELHKCHHNIDAVVKIEVPDGNIIERISGRRVDPETKKIYHVKFNPPPKEIADRVIQRGDDNEETLRNRLEKYHSDTAPLIDYYEERGLLTRVAGIGKVEEVTQRIIDATKIKDRL